MSWTNDTTNQVLMKTQLNFLAAGIFLAALGTGFGQSTLQFSASTYTVYPRRAQYVQRTKAVTYQFPGGRGDGAERTIPRVRH